MSDETPPDDDDVASKLRARRRLTLMPQTTGNGGLRVSVSPSACDTELETPTRVVGDVTPPPGLGRKRPGSFDKEHSTRAKLQGFEYASSKKPKHTTSSALPVLSQLDQDIPPSQVRGCTTTDVQSSPRRNPFAKTLLCQRNSKSPLGASQDSVARGEIDTEPLRLSQNHGSVDAVDETSVTRMMPTNDTSTLSSEPRQRSFMTSEDFITTCPPRSSLLEQVNGLAQSSNGQNNLGRPTFTSQKVAYSFACPKCVCFTNRLLCSYRDCHCWVMRGNDNVGQKASLSTVATKHDFPHTYCRCVQVEYPFQVQSPKTVLRTGSNQA